ncbi:MAG TPA: ABC transporter substrate-binding protein [Vicinamibacterales bacterium]|nr:ABC transporter substrate-binding protein [Vicinamibacterales bacterium]
MKGEYVFRPYGRASLLSVMLTAVAITANHLFTLGAGALFLGAALLAVPAALFTWFRRTGSKPALVGYVLVNALIVVGFGAIKGLWGSTLPVLVGTMLSSISTAYPKPVFGAFWYEMSGIVTFLGSLFVLFYGIRLVPTPGSRRSLATTAAVAFASIVVAFVWTTKDAWVPPANGVVRIGVIVPSAGPYALLGNSFVKAVQMAKDDLKNTKYRYELVVKDSGPDPAKANDVISQVVNVDNVDAIVGGISLIGQVTKRYAATARIPHLCVCTVTSIGDGAYNFTNIPTPEAEATAWVHEAQRRGIRTIAMISQDYPSINNHVRALKAEAARAGLVIVHENRFEGSRTDFQSLIARANASATDVFYVEALNPTLDLLGEQLATAGVRNISSVVAPSLSQRPELFEGAWYTDSNLEDMGFKERFEDRYPATQFATHMMPYAYDSVNMIARAFEQGQNPAVYLRDLRTYAGTAGTVTKEPGSGNFKSAPAVWVIRDGKPSLFSTPQSTARYR